MKRTVLALTFIAVALGAAALDFVLKDGTLVSGELRGSVSLKTAYSVVSLEGKLIKSIVMDSPARIELNDLSVQVGVIGDRSLTVASLNGVVVLELKDISFVNGDAPGGSIGGIDFVSLSGGEFVMGDSVGGGEKDARPVHKVWVDGFKMSKYEITLKQFQAFVADAGYKTQSRWQGGGDDFPVVEVSWNDAQAFCAWFSRKYGVAARLPTEAEWEYAARGGLIGKAFPNGDVISDEETNYGNVNIRRTGSLLPNGYGLYDMAGNAWEWCGDWYGASYYASSPARNPKGPPSGLARVYRGGGWRNWQLEALSVSNRNFDRPGDFYDVLGFRLVVSPSP